MKSKSQLGSTSTAGRSTSLKLRHDALIVLRAPDKDTWRPTLIEQARHLQEETGCLVVVLAQGYDLEEIPRAELERILKRMDEA